MTYQEAIQVLKIHQEWRLGAEIEMFEPKVLTEAIDRILMLFEERYTKQEFLNAVEQKQHLIDIMKADEELGLYELGQEVGHSVQVQQTLEEAAKELYPIEYTGRMFMPNRDELNNSYKQEAFIEGAKWQQERMYSEEQVIELIQFLSMDKDFNGYGSVYKATANYFLEKFKKL